MRLLSPLNATRALLILSCLVVAGYYIFVQRDLEKDAVEPRKYSYSKPYVDVVADVAADDPADDVADGVDDDVANDITRDYSDMKSPKITASNSSVFSEIPSSVQQVAVGVSKNDTRKNDTNRIDTSRIEGKGARKPIDLHGMTPQEMMDRTVIVTAISQNHLRESKGMISSVQEFLPKARIIMYDLGLKPSGIALVRRICNVELRNFNFTKYPPHVKDLRKYAWKPLIIQETLDEFDIIFWCDASARFQKDPLILFSLLEEQNGFIRRTVEYQPYKMLARTHPKMFDKLGIDREKFRKDFGYAMCFEANRLLFANSALIQENIIVPWADCAKVRDCISPEGSVLGMNVKGPIRYTHRYDQAALALVAYKNMRGVWNENNDRTKLFHEVVGLSRTPKGSDKVKLCKK